MTYNILILDTGKEWGGGTLSLLELLTRIDRSRFNFYAIFYHNYQKGSGEDIKTELEKLGINFILIPQKIPPLTFKFLKELSKGLLFFSNNLKKFATYFLDYCYRIKPNAKIITQIIKDLKIDMIYRNNQPATNLEGIIAAKLTRIPALQHCRIEPKLNPLILKYLNYVDKIICVSEGIRNKFLSFGVDPRKCIRIYDGIIDPEVSVETLLQNFDKDKIREELDISRDEVVIGTVNSLVKRKRVDVLIEAFYLAKNLTQKKLKLVIVGDGPERPNLERLVKKKKLEKEVRFTGFKNNVFPYVNVFDVFVLTSEKEGLPRVVVEAMYLEKPVIASNIIGPSEVVMDGKTGFLVPPNDPYTFAKKISILVNDPHLRKNMGIKGKEKVIKEFNVKNYVNQVTQVFEEILQKKKIA